MTKLPIILDDIVDHDFQNEIEDCFFDCFWTYYNDNTLGSKSADMKYRKFLSPLDYDISPAFISNMLTSKNENAYNKILPMIKKSCDQIKFKVEKVDRCYGAIHAIIKNTPKIDNIHINNYIPHLVMLYYVNECDGDTILYDKMVGDIPSEVNWYPDEYCKFNVVSKITPKRGRVLFFDGRTYHSASSPTKSVRTILTLDLFGEFVDGSYKFPGPRKQMEKNNYFRYQ